MIKWIVELKPFNRQVTQRLTNSFKNRYPDLFIASQLYFFATKKTPKVLSFGCSHGEELFTLRGLFPNSEIVGVEKNWLVRHLCRFRTRVLQCAVFGKLSDINPSEKFDLIFVLAVLQNTDDHGKQIKLFTFEHFEFWINQLHDKLPVNGLLVIDNCDYNFLDCRVAADYIPLNFERNFIKPNRIINNRYSQAAPNIKGVYRIFQRVRDDNRK